MSRTSSDIVGFTEAPFKRLEEVWTRPVNYRSTAVSDR